MHVKVKRIEVETDKAFLLWLEEPVGNLKNGWVPKSVVADADMYKEGDQAVEISIREWFVEKQKVGNIC